MRFPRHRWSRFRTRSGRRRAHALLRQGLHGREDRTLVHRGEHQAREEQRQRGVGVGVEEEGQGEGQRRQRRDDRDPQPPAAVAAAEAICDHAQQAENLFVAGNATDYVREVPSILASDGKCKSFKKAK